MNPYPCGFYCDSQKACTCGPSTVTKYQKRISGPLLDRTDIDIEVPRVDYKKLSSTQVGETSASIRQRVQTARDIQNQRFSRCGLQCRYARRGGKAILQGVALSLSKCQSLMRAAMSQLNLSARAYHRILKLSRTIADLAGSEEIESAHLAEALQYRPKIMLG